MRTVSPDDVVDWLDLPDYRPAPVRRLRPLGGSAHRYARPRVTIALDDWRAVADDARRLGLRGAAQVWGVSHETIAKIRRAVDASITRPAVDTL